MSSVLPTLAQNCDVDFPGVAAQNFSTSCDGSSSKNLTLGKDTYMDDGDTFTFDTSVINITGNLTINSQGNGKIIIPAGVTVNVEGNVQFKGKGSGCTSSSPCILEIEVNGRANFEHNFQNEIMTIVWSGSGTIVVDDHFKNSSDGCMTCATGGCPNFKINSDCKDEGSNCAGEDFCSVLAACSSDTVAPVITGCPADQVVTLAASTCTQSVSWTAPTASDNCNLASLSTTHSPDATFSSGTTTVTYTATDAAGNTSTCSFNVNVVDNTVPVITACPADITISANASCQGVATWEAPTFTDNCTGGTLTTTQASGSTFPKGTTTVTYTATDAAGNTSTCSFTVNVVDSVAPVITNCPTNITVEATSCSMIVNWTPPSADSCIPVTINSSHNPGDEFYLGDTKVTYTVEDSNGGVSSCTFNVIVKNKDTPLISNCPNQISIEANEAGVAIVNWIEPIGSAQCGEVTLTSSHQPGDLFNIGTTVVEYKATDETGGIHHCSFNVIVSQAPIQIDISKVVTPDGDGINDTWTLTNINKFEDNKVVIIDRWGGMIFNGSGYNNQNIVWRGTNRSGEIVPTGTYFYTITIHHGSQKFNREGFIELIR